MAAYTKIWIAGPRAWESVDPIEKLLRRLVSNYGVANLVLVSGGAPGVDTLVVKAAQVVEVPVFENKALWNLWHRAAGPIRNSLIADIFQPHALIALHYYDLGSTDHVGTQSAIKVARKRGIHVKTLKYPPEVALPSAHDDRSPMGNRARAERGLPPKPKKAKRAASKRKRTGRDA